MNLKIQDKDVPDIYSLFITAHEKAKAQIQNITKAEDGYLVRKVCCSKCNRHQKVTEVHQYDTFVKIQNLYIKNLKIIEEKLKREYNRLRKENKCKQ